MSGFTKSCDRSLLCIAFYAALLISLCARIGSAQPEPQADTGGARREPPAIATLVAEIERDMPDLVKRDSQGRVLSIHLTRRWCNDECLALLPQLNELRELILQGGRTNQLSAAGLRVLRGNARLSTVRFWCFGTNLPPGCLSELATLPTLTQVSLWGADSTVNDYRTLAGKTNLADFRISASNFGDADFAQFTNAASLKNFMADGVALTRVSVALLPHFRALTNALLRYRDGRIHCETNWSSVASSARNARPSPTPYKSFPLEN